MAARVLFVVAVAAVVVVGIARAATPTLVVKQISRDPYADDAQHATEVEPDTASFGSTVVAAFQVGRYFDGGASNIGFATSTDRGLTWRSGYLPSLTFASAPPGPWARGSDPAVAYDALHGRWLISSLVLNASTMAMVVSGSNDGVTWDAPVVAAPGALVRGTITLDKEWIACDSWPQSPFRGRCYLSYSDFATGAIATRTSMDGGRTWSPAVDVPVGEGDTGPQPVVRPNGELLLVFRHFNMTVVRSTDGGASFAAPETVASVTARRVVGFRTIPFPTVEVDGTGAVYVAWQDCRFRRGCSGNDIVVARSADGRTWRRPIRVPADPVRSGASHVLPGIAVDPARPGRIAVIYHTFRRASCTPATCRIDVSMIASRTGGATWMKPRRLNRTAMRLPWLAATTSGLMLGDYVSASFAGGRAVGVFALARAPRSGRLDEAMSAASLAVP